MLLAKRFSREQGRKPDGCLKLQAVDDESDTGVNACALLNSKMQTDGIDLLVRTAVLLQRATGRTPLHLSKADTDSAFRRIPVRPDHRWMAAVLFAIDDGVCVAKHYAMSAGGVAAVQARGRVAAMVNHTARPPSDSNSRASLKILSPPSERSRSLSLWTALHIFCCFYAIAPHKLEHRSPLVVLGRQVTFDNAAVMIGPSPEKAEMV